MNNEFDKRQGYEVPQSEVWAIQFEECILSSVNVVEDYHGERITSSSDQPGF